MSASIDSLGGRWQCLALRSSGSQCETTAWGSGEGDHDRTPYPQTHAAPKCRRADARELRAGHDRRTCTKGVHLASFFVSVPSHRRNLAHIRRGADRAGRAPGTDEIDISMPCSISPDGRAARNAAKRPAAIGILWTAAADDVLDQFALAGTAEECAARLRVLQRELPEVTGVRIYAVPPLPSRA